MSVHSAQCTQQILLASCMSLGMMETYLVWMAHSCMMYTSTASYRTIMAEIVQHCALTWTLMV